jgi:hypothetical protein
MRFKEKDKETWEDVERDGIVSLLETDFNTQNTVRTERRSNLF